MSRENKCYQTEDGPIWGSRSVAVVNLVIYGTNPENPLILLTRRSDSMTDAPGKWCLPCGYLDWDETTEEAAMREVLQETGLDLEALVEEGSIIPPILLGVDSDPFSNRQNVTFEYTTIIEEGLMPQLTPNEECSEVIWCSTEKLKELKNDFAFNHLQLIIKLVDAGTKHHF